MKNLEKDGTFTDSVHHFNSQTQAITFMCNSNTWYTDVHAKSNFVISQIRTVLKRSNLIWYYGLVICNLIPAEMKYVDSLKTFRSK